MLPNNIIKIADTEFFISKGEIVNLEDILNSIVPAEFLRYFSDLKSLLSIDVESLDLPIDQKNRLASEIYRISLLPLSLASIILTSPNINITIDYKQISIGNKEESDCKIPYKSDYNIKIQYIHPYYTIIPEESSPIYRKLRPEEEFILYPGNIIRIGKVELLASRFNVGRWSHIGKRSSMEDADVICHNLFVYEEMPLAYYAVFDGHGGNQCSDFLKKNLQYNLQANLLHKHHTRYADVINVLKSSIISTFAEVDQKFLMEFSESCYNVGSAAIICMILGDRIITANLGDSRAVLSRRGRAIELSSDHKPDKENELKRILANGGSVMLGRIHSKLAVSRAFGDSEFKLGDKGGLLSIEPEITQIFIDPFEDEFIVIGCDGLFEAYSSQEIVTNIKKKLAVMPPTEQDPNRVIRELVNDAVFENRTTDNVTALLICLSSGIGHN